MDALDNLLKSTPVKARPVLEAIALAQDRHKVLPVRSGDEFPPAPVVVGLSGGADSVCLLHALCLLARPWNLTIHAAHVDHGLRAESREDARIAERLAGKLKLEFHLRRLDGQTLRSDARGIEAAARAMRYAFLAEVAQAVSSQPHAQGAGSQVLPTVAVGHHMDDQAETVLMNFVRGSGLPGLAGMPWVHELGELDRVRLARPLLGLRRSQILDYADAFGLHYVEDCTNQDPSYIRNRIRHEVLPALAELNPQIIETLARTAQILGPESERSAGLDRQALVSVTAQADPPLRFVLDLERFEKLSRADQRGALRAVCARMGLDLRNVGYDNLEEVLWKIRESHGTSGPQTLAGDVVWSLLAGTAAAPRLLSVHRNDALPLKPDHPHLSECRPGITLPYALRCPGVHEITPHWALHCRRLTRDGLPGDWQAPGHPWRAFLDADSVQAPVLNVPATGQRFSPLGMPEQRKSLGNFFTDRKTPPALRSQWPILVDESSNAIVWVCGLAIAHQARIKVQTRRVVCLEWLPARQPFSTGPVGALEEGTACA